MSDTLTFVATVEKVQTMADGAVRVTLDLPETALAEMAALAACRVKGLVLKFEVSEAEAPPPKRTGLSELLNN